jgi:hypothetical protein
VFNELEMSTHYSTFVSTTPTATPLTGTAYGAHLRVCRFVWIVSENGYCDWK